MFLSLHRHEDSSSLFWGPLETLHADTAPTRTLKWEKWEKVKNLFSTKSTKVHTPFSISQYLQVFCKVERTWLMVKACGFERLNKSTVEMFDSIRILVFWLNWWVPMEKEIYCHHKTNDVCLPYENQFFFYLLVKYDKHWWYWYVNVVDKVI